MTFDFIKACNGTLGKILKFDGSEHVWEEYVFQNILFYTALFENMMKFFCQELQFQAGDTGFLKKIGIIFAADSEGNILNHNLNIHVLDQMAKSNTIPSFIKE